MKIFIVFCAIAILNTMFFIYQSDMNSYIRENAMVKSTAEECASGAALFYDEEALGEGYYRFDREEAEKYVRFILENNFQDIQNVTYEILYQDAQGALNPAVEVIVRVSGEDRFRLSFLEKDFVKRAAYYEYTDYF